MHCFTVMVQNTNENSQLDSVDTRLEAPYIPQPKIKALYLGMPHHHAHYQLASLSNFSTSSSVWLVTYSN